MSDEVKTVEMDGEPGGRGCMVAMGLLCIVTGLASMGAPLMTGSFVTGTIGVLLMAAGILELMSAFSAGGWKAGVPAFLSGVVAIIAGGLLVANPVLGAGAVSAMLIAFFLVDGIVRCILAFKLKPLEGWGWALTAGILSVVLRPCSSGGVGHFRDSGRWAS